jgi:ADP-heptose:LPS heptosyltransferase
MRFLVIRFSSIGDIVLTTPVLRLLKKKFPDCNIHFLTKKQFVSVVEKNPNIEHVHVLKDSFSETLSELKKFNFERVIDLHNNIRSARVKKAIKAKSKTFNKLNYKKWLLVNFKINKLPNVHIVDRYIETIADLGIENDNAGLDFFVDNKNLVIKEKLTPEIKKGYIALVTGAAHYTKQLNDEKLIELCNLLKHPIVLIGGSEEKVKGEYVKNSSSNPHIFNAAGITNLNESAFLINEAKIVISPDTGMMHIASALKKDVISVWGNTVPEFGMYPYYPGKHSVIFQINDLKCRPCSKIGYKACPKKHFSCIEMLNMKEIAQKVDEIW